MSERDIQTRIRNALGQCADLCLWRNNTGMLVNQRGQRVSFGLSVGSADLIGILSPIGRFVALEIKQPGKHQTKQQEQWLALVRTMGGFAAVVTSETEALDAIERARQGHSQ